MNNLFGNSKPKHLDKSSLCVRVSSGQTYLCALHGEQCALLEQTRIEGNR